MQIGLIGGIGPAAQDYYTRRLISLFAQADVPLDMTTVHANAETLLSNIATDRRSEQAEIFANLTERLAFAEAKCVAVTSIAGHFCRQEFTSQSSLPVIDMVSTVAQDVAKRGLDRIGILGTRTVMESHFYGGITMATLVPPPESEIDEVHAAYVAMALAGVITAEQQTVFNQAARRMIETDGAKAILLGGTDLVLAFDPSNSRFPLVDCAAIHVQAIAEYVISGAVAA
ncbi:MAG: aspartate/glutamate racemase family protein [Parasphingorhabdus sp.]